MTAQSEEPDVVITGASSNSDWSRVVQCGDGIGHKWVRDLDGDVNHYKCEHCGAHGVAAE